MQDQQAVRGSEKLWSNVFEMNPLEDEELSRALDGAQMSYKIKRWWWFGQPRIDLIKATVDVELAQAGKMIQEIVQVHGSEVQVDLGVFPYGTPWPEGVRLDVEFRRNIERG